MSKTWYWRPKWSMFRDSEVQILSVERTHEYHQQLGQCAVSWLDVTYKDVCNFKSCVVFGNCSFTHLQEQSHIHFLHVDSGSPRKLGLTGDLLVFASPSSWSCPLSLLIEWLFTIELPVGKMLPQCFWKMSSAVEGYLPGSVFALSHCPFNFPLTIATEHLDVFLNIESLDHWLSLPWALIILEMDLGFGSNVQAGNRKSA